MAVESTEAPKPSSTESHGLSADLGREWSLLASIPHNIGTGIIDRVQDALQHKGLTALEIGASFAVAAGLSFLTKQPGMIGTVAGWTPKVLLGLTAADMARRFAGPMVDTWQHPGNLMHDEQQLGSNLGSAVVDYPLVAMGGYAGDRISSGLIEHFTPTPTDVPTDGQVGTLKDIVAKHGRLIGRHALNGPLAFGLESLDQKIFPDQGLYPSFPKTVAVSGVSKYNELNPDQPASVIPSGGIKLTNSDQTSSFGIKVDKNGPVRLDLNMDGPGTNWADNNKESAVVSVYVDGKYSQDMVLFGGSKSEKYTFALEDMSAGDHTVTLRYAPEKSTDGATGIDVNSGTAEQYTYKTPMEKWIDEYAPVLYGRYGIDNNHTDVPMAMFHHESKNANGTETILYGYIFSNEDGGTGSVPAVEQARWGRMTDIQDVLKLNVDPTTGKTSDVQYEGAGDTWMPFKGSLDGTHPVIEDATLNNDVTYGETGPLLYRMEPDYAVPSNAPIEDLQRQNPLWWQTSSVEIEREGKVDLDGMGDKPDDSGYSAVNNWIKQYVLGEGPPKMADPRNYLYVEQDLKNATAADPVAAQVVLKNGKTYVSDFGFKDVAIGRSGWTQTDVALPPNTTPSDIAKLEFVSRGPGDAQVESVGHVYMLSQNYVPYDVSVPTDTKIIQQNAPAQGDFPNKQSTS